MAPPTEAGFISAIVNDSLGEKIKDALPQRPVGRRMTLRVIRTSHVRRAREDRPIGADGGVIAERHDLNRASH